MEPLLEPVPDCLTTSRLILRSPRAADAAAVNAAVIESMAALRPYMPWAQTEPSLTQSEGECRRMQARFLLREDLPMFIFERNADGAEAGFVGGTGLHRIDWAVRRFEVGYWCRSSRVGRGYIGEAVEAITRCAFEQLRARRLEIRMDGDNERSRLVAERAGFILEGVLRCQAITPTGEPRDTRVYARLRDASGG
jgi:RimJ/RimL family protein N-acetyltransferase